MELLHRFGLARGEPRIIINGGEFRPPHQAQCHVRLPFPDPREGTWQFCDLMNAYHYEYKGDRLASAGLYLDMPAWAYHVFEVGSIRC